MNRRYHSFSMRGAVSNYTLAKYGLSREDYNRMVKEQEHKCGVCGLWRPLVIDHNHETGQVRALLCRVCNMLVGIIEHCSERIEQARAYLRRFK